MPAGIPYFAWVDVGETTFGPEHMRWDENVFSFELSQSEGDPASLTVVVLRPRNEAGDPIGLLGPGRKIWAWFALDCGPALVKFRGRLVGIPTSIFEERVTLEFVARPGNVVAQKEALAATLRVLPFYDEVVIDPSRRNDPEVVLEGYTAIWHYDRETHVLTISDELNGEDGTLDFDGVSGDGKVLYDGLGLSLTSGPLSRVDVSAEYTWTQLGHGSVDLTRYLADSMGNATGTLPSYTFTMQDWPKPGASLGDGWEVVASGANELYGISVMEESGSIELTVDWWDGEKTVVKSSYSTTFMPAAPPQSWVFPTIMTKFEDKVTYAQDGAGRMYPASYNANGEWKWQVMPAHYTKGTLEAGYKAGRPCTERISFTLFADVQHVLTEPEDGEALRVDGIRSVNLSEPLGGETGAEVPIGDPRRRSYIATERGNRSFEHLILLARAHLMKRARVVEISFAPKLSRMPEVTLRKNVLLNEPRLGEAFGKIIGYSLALDGSDGRIQCQVRIGCTIGRGGAVVATEGTPTYCTIEYAGSDYQQFAGRTVLIGDGSDVSVCYAPPVAAPNDDGIDFLSRLSAQDVIEQDVVIENTLEEQQDYIGEFAVDWDNPFGNPFEPGQEKNDFAKTRMEAINNTLKKHPTRMVFKLKGMSSRFTTDYDLTVSTLHIPLGYDLEAA